ncbi:cytochrome P450 [Cyathus striatus]|nr:cytochrome P450 [Cyathus striatus]
MFANPYIILLAAFGMSWLLVLYKSGTQKLRHIPTVGYSSLLLSYISAIKFIIKGTQVIQERYEKARGMFKVPMLQTWLVIVSGEELLQEVKTAPDSLLSAVLGLDELLQFSYTVGSEMVTNPYHASVIRTHLTRNLANLIPGMRDEMLTVFSETIPEKEEWVNYNASGAFEKVLARLSNRVIVGFPLCRSEDFLENAVRFTNDLVGVSALVCFLPPFLRPFSRYAFRSIANRTNVALKLLEPVIAQCRKLEDHTNDLNELTFLKWLILEANGDEQENIRLTKRVLMTNFAAIHTTSSAFLQTLYYLAANPSYIKPLREEIDKVISQDGWSKNSLDKLIKIDSFIREVQRLHPLVGITSFRKVMEDYTFCDGTFIPQNTILAVASDCVQRDNDIYPNAHEFDGFRFSRVNDGTGNRKNDIVSLSNNFLSFGIGKHACPGRFFAAYQLKLLLSHVIVNYDVKFEDEGVRPEDVLLGFSRNPNPKAEIMFRKRVYTQ